MKLIYVRHGQTDWNVQRRIQGVTDIPLNETGIAQAHQVAGQLKEEPIDFIVSSTLQRARHTAQIIRGDRDIPIVYDERLVERRFGGLEGTSFDNLFCPELNNLDVDFLENGVEPLRALVGRVSQAIEELREKHPGETVLVVSHGGVSVALHCYYYGIREGKIDRTGILSKNCVPVIYDELPRRL